MLKTCLSEVKEKTVADREEYLQLLSVKVFRQFIDITAFFTREHVPFFNADHKLAKLEASQYFMFSSSIGSSVYKLGENFKHHLLISQNIQSTLKFLYSHFKVIIPFHIWTEDYRSLFRYFSEFELIYKGLNLSPTIPDNLVVPYKLTASAQMNLFTAYFFALNLEPQHYHSLHILIAQKLGKYLGAFVHLYIMPLMQAMREILDPLSLPQGFLFSSSSYKEDFLKFQVIQRNVLERFFVLADVHYEANLACLEDDFDVKSIYSGGDFYWTVTEYLDLKEKRKKLNVEVVSKRKNRASCLRLDFLLKAWISKTLVFCCETNGFPVTYKNIEFTKKDCVLLLNLLTQRILKNKGVLLSFLVNHDPSKRTRSADIFEWPFFTSIFGFISEWHSNNPDFSTVTLFSDFTVFHSHFLVETAPEISRGNLILSFTREFNLVFTFFRFSILCLENSSKSQDFATCLAISASLMSTSAFKSQTQRLKYNKFIKDFRLITRDEIVKSRNFLEVYKFASGNIYFLEIYRIMDSSFFYEEKLTPLLLLDKIFSFVKLG